MRLAHAAAGFFWGGLISVAFHPIAHAASTVTVDDVLALAQKNSDTLQALDRSRAAVEADIAGRDLVLSPTLKSELGATKDLRSSLSPAASRSGQTTFLDTTLSLPFSTGTTFSISGRHDLIDDPPTGTDTAHIGAWDIRLEQSLWRDAFGRATRLRREGETHELKRQRMALLLERQNFLTNVESAFWDLVFTRKEEEVRQKNIERSVSLEKWMRRRVAQFAAEKQDLMQVQTLLRQRRLDLTITRNEREEVLTRLRQLIPGVEPAAWHVDLRVLERERVPRQLLAVGSAPGAGQPVRLDALVAKSRALELKTAMAKVDDSLRPELNLYASYGANGIDPEASPAWQDAGRADTPRTTVGLQLSVELAGSLKNKRRASARLDAEAEELRANALARASRLAWSELERTITSLKEQIKEAREIHGLHRLKLDAERKRFEQGRASTLQMTTFEVEAAESELTLYRLLASLRKTEAAARAFAHEETVTR